MEALGVSCSAKEGCSSTATLGSPLILTKAMTIVMTLLHLWREGMKGCWRSSCHRHRGGFSAAWLNTIKIRFLQSWHALGVVDGEG